MSSFIHIQPAEFALYGLILKVCIQETEGSIVASQLIHLLFWRGNLILLAKELASEHQRHSLGESVKNE